MPRVYHWIYTATMKEAVYAKIANIILKESTVTSANRNTIDHTERVGMKPMCAHVRLFYRFSP